VLEAAATPAEPREHFALRALLVALDVSAFTIAWLLALPVWARGMGPKEAIVLLVGIVTCSIGLVAAQGLYLARVSSVRSVEIARLGRVVLLVGLGAFVVTGRIGTEMDLAGIALGSVFAFLCVNGGRGAYNGWLRRSRTRGRFCRIVVIVGTGDEGRELVKLLALHPETGYRVVGIAGPRAGVGSGCAGVAWLGEIDQVPEALAEAGANGVIVAASDLGSEELNTLTRTLMREGVHMHLSSGLRGIDHRRLRSLPLAHEPLFYVERASLSRAQLCAKRMLDFVVGGLVGFFALPLLLVGAIAVKLGDGGPVLFRQTRIGRDGRPFTLFKLRTMVPDAEEQLVDLSLVNDREGGPLFKAEADPRRTRVGKLLERISIDELPQLWNVLRGDMSLVGPRPAEPHEVAQFDDEFLDRHRVLPGITGLWQVEGRDKPEFDVYRRLDLFYVENWTIGLDLAILFRTAGSVFGRFALGFSRRSSPEVPPSSASA